MQFRPLHALPALALGVGLSLFAQNQLTTPPPDPAESNLPQPDWVKLYAPQRGLTEPVLLNPSPAQSECTGFKSNGTVKFLFVVDSSGFSRNVIFEKALANEIDLLALKIIVESRFQPATLNDIPVAVGQSVEMHLQVCATSAVDQSGKASETVRLQSAPEEKFEFWRHPPAKVDLAPLSMPAGFYVAKSMSGLTPPRVLVHPAPPEGKGHSGKTSFTVIVDEHGLPRDLNLIKASDPALVPGVLLCFSNMRFKPALKDGMPIPARITEELDITSP